MNERDKRKQELLNELSKRFTDSAQTMRNLAARIKQAAEQSQLHQQRLERSSANLRDALDSQQGPLPFSYLEFLEFSNSDEFAKYRDMPAISDEELSSLDLDELCLRLQEAQESAGETTE